MKNILFKMLPMMAAVLLATSCSKDDGSEIPAAPDNNNPNSVTIPETNDLVQTVVDKEVPSIPFSITVGKEGNESLSKTYIWNTLSECFDEGDQLDIVVKNTDITGTLYLVEGNGKETATFEGTLKGNDLLTLSNGTFMDATLSNAKYNNEGKPLTKATEFWDIQEASRKCGYWTGEIKYGASSFYLVQNTVFLRVRNVAEVSVQEPDASEFTTFHTGTGVIAVPNLSKVKSSAFSGVKEVDYDKNENANRLIVHNIYRNKPNDDCLPDLYSINPTTKVFFSKGNLRYGLSEGTVSFASNQWDLGYVGKETGYDVGDDHTTMGTGYIDLFGWGTWLDANRINGDEMKVTTKEESKYQWSGDDHSPFDSEWFTLTSDEWDYLLNKRETAGGVRFVKANLEVGGGKYVKGLIILPDNCKVTADQLKGFFKTDDDIANSANVDFHSLSNTYWNNMWATLGDPVFLPVVGSRDGTKLGRTGEDAYYWTSNSTSKHAMSVYFMTFGIYSQEVFRSQGCAVRLVHAMTD